MICLSRQFTAISISLAQQRGRLAALRVELPKTLLYYAGVLIGYWLVSPLAEHVLQKCPQDVNGQGWFPIRIGGM